MWPFENARKALRAAAPFSARWTLQKAVYYIRTDHISSAPIEVEDPRFDSAPTLI